MRDTHLVCFARRSWGHAHTWPPFPGQPPSHTGGPRVPEPGPARRHWVALREDLEVPKDDRPWCPPWPAWIAAVGGGQPVFMALAAAQLGVWSPLAALGGQLLDEQHVLLSGTSTKCHF